MTTVIACSYGIFVALSVMLIKYQLIKLCIKLVMETKLILSWCQLQQLTLESYIWPRIFHANQAFYLFEDTVVTETQIIGRGLSREPSH